MMEFVSWDDELFPTEWKVIKKSMVPVTTNQMKKLLVYLRIIGIFPWISGGFQKRIPPSDPRSPRWRAQASEPQGSPPQGKDLKATNSGGLIDGFRRFRYLIIIEKKN
jgi:hypothetical protein